MSSSGGKDEVLADYAVAVRALVPEALGFYCHGGAGLLLWSEPAREMSLDPAWEQRIAILLQPGAPPGGPERLVSDRAVAYLLPITGGAANEPILGLLTVMVAAADGAQPATDFVGRLRPILRTLGREVSLRRRLLEAQRKLNVQAAEERLLHEIDKTAQRKGETAEILGYVAALCRQHLRLDTVAISVPEKHISLVQGGRLSAIQVEGMVRDLGDADPEVTRAGIWKDQDTFVIPVRYSHQEVPGVLALAGWGSRPDFSDRRCARIARYIASHVATIIEREYDGLTGLLAWPSFETRLNNACQDESSGQHVVVYLDIDGLHVVNETLGRGVGDEIVMALARLMREELKDGVVARVSGDAFAALLPFTRIDDARERVDSVCKRFRELEYRGTNSVYRPSVSIGVGPLVNEDSESGGPLATAQVACRAAKDRGRNRVEAYQCADLSIVQRLDDIQRVGHVRSAIDRNRLTLLAQPILPTSKRTGHPYWEILVRLLDDNDQVLLPADFISAAERYKLMEDLDRWVVATTLASLGPCSATLASSNARFAINLSGQSLGSEKFLEFIEQQLAATAVPASLICFEITESVAVANMQQAQTLMQSLKRLGCHFSLDDFGTGLSSFAYLKLFPVDTLKIDGSFVRDLSANVVSQSVVAAISEVARVMKLETVAEFVENQPTLDLLSRLGVTWGQGYLLGVPESLAKVLSPYITHAPPVAPSVPAVDSPAAVPDVTAAIAEAGASSS